MNVFSLLSLLNSFTRKQEIELAKYWLDAERDKLKDRNKPPQLYNSKGEAIPIQPVSEQAFYNQIEDNFFEELENKKI